MGKTVVFGIVLEIHTACFILTTFVILQHWLRSFSIGEYTSLVQLEVTGKNMDVMKKDKQIIKDYNCGMGGVHLPDQKTTTYKLDRKSSDDMMDISVLSLEPICKLWYTKGLELLDLRIVWAKTLIGTHNSLSQNTPVIHVPCREVLPASVLLNFPVLQKTTGKCRCCHSEGIENKKCIQCNTCAAFLCLISGEDLETVLQIPMPKFKDNYYYFISRLSFTLCYLAIILFI